jgi:YD repeat-containing protein
LSYDAENRLVGVSGAASAVFVYDGDGKRVKATLNSVTTTYVGNYYETSGSSVRKYYFFGALRVAMRQDSTLSYLFGDHLGYTSITADSRGNKTAEMRCLAGGEQRYHAGQVSFHGASGQDEA